MLTWTWGLVNWVLQSWIILWQWLRILVNSRFQIGFWTERKITRMANSLKLYPINLTWSSGMILRDSRKSVITGVWGTTGAFVFVVSIPRLQADCWCLKEALSRDVLFWRLDDFEAYFKHIRHVSYTEFVWFLIECIANFNLKKNKKYEGIMLSLIGGLSKFDDYISLTYILPPSPSILANTKSSTLYQENFFCFI